VLPTGAGERNRGFPGESTAEDRTDRRREVFSMKVITWKETSEQVNWQDLADLLNRAFARTHEPVNKPGYVLQKRADSGDQKGGHQRTAESVRTVFSRSYGVVYAYDGEKLIACGRVLSDGLEQAAIYNIAVDPDYQGYQLGRGVIARLLEQVEGCETILYTHPQTVKFYETLGFRRMKTGFVIHAGGSFSEFEQKEGFLLPEGYRYEEDESDYYAVPAEHAEKMD
jgi:ribosomal protein S18 acetylase RimI-like enzyme